MGAVLDGWASIIVGSWAGLWDDVQMGGVEGEWVGLEARGRGCMMTYAWVVGARVWLRVGLMADGWEDESVTSQCCF